MLHNSHCMLQLVCFGKLPHRKEGFCRICHASPLQAHPHLDCKAARRILITTASSGIPCVCPGPPINHVSLSLSTTASTLLTNHLHNLSVRPLCHIPSLQAVNLVALPHTLYTAHIRCETVQLASHGLIRSSNIDDLLADTLKLKPNLRMTDLKLALQILHYKVAIRGPPQEGQVACCLRHSRCHRLIQRCNTFIIHVHQPQLLQK